MYCSFLIDPIEVGYEFTVYTTSEGERFIQLCAVVTSHVAGSPRPFTIASTTEDGVASTISIISQHIHVLSLLCLRDINPFLSCTSQLQVWTILLLVNNWSLLGDRIVLAIQ